VLKQWNTMTCMFETEYIITMRHVQLDVSWY
jgi:hypothetical protein